MNQHNEAMNWDDPIEEISALKPGTYSFKVIGFDRAEFEGSDKIPPCPMAVLKLEINGQYIKCNLHLTRRLQWKIMNFFESIGLRRGRNPYTPEWNKILGREGRCKLSVYMNNGQEYNRVDDFLPEHKISMEPPF